MVKEFAQNSVSELREMLVKSGKYTEEQAQEIKGKSKLVEAILELGNLEDLQSSFENAEVETPVLNIANQAEVEGEETSVQEQTDYNHPDWPGYVLSLFTENELVDGTYPKLIGLRRVAEMLLGPVVKSGPVNVFPATSLSDSGRASVVYSVAFDWKSEGLVHEFSACADAWHGNSEEPYNIYPLCIAENRAEARALRRALKLNIVAAEEITMSDRQRGVKEETNAGEWQESDKISEAQIIFIRKKCGDLDINVESYINSEKEQYTDIREISRVAALKMIERLNQYQTSTDKSVEIPTELKISDK
jgi:hypothetical protein